MSVSIYATTAEPGRVMLVYRSPGRWKVGRLLERLLQRTAELARLRG